MAQELDEDLATRAREFFAQIPFNQVLGIHVEYLAWDEVRCSLRMQPQLIGNFVLQSLHGGVTASILDVTGGAMAFIGTYQKLKQHTAAERLARLAKLGTIDLRVDYLLPGRGVDFIASANLLRCGNKVSVVRMALHNDAHQLIAVGTGTYICG